MNEVEGEFAGEGEVEFGSAGAGMIDRDDYFPGGLHLRLGREGDDVGGAGVIHELGMDGRDSGVVDKNDGEFPCGERELREGLKAVGKALGGAFGVTKGGVAVTDGEFHLRIWARLRVRWGLGLRLWGIQRGNGAC